MKPFHADIRNLIESILFHVIAIDDDATESISHKIANAKEYINIISFWFDVLAQWKWPYAVDSTMPMREMQEWNWKFP